MTCTESGCDREEYCNGLCSRHYERLRTTGTTADGPKARAPLHERFWKKVDVCGENECWNWTAKSKTKGYGVISLGGRDGGKMLSHRAAWTLTNGEIPSGDGFHGTVVMHECDNRLCCNPSHLRLGTQPENVKDMDQKGRRKHSPQIGSRHHNSRFTEQDVRYMRRSQKINSEIAKEFGCARQVVGSIRLHKSWKHVN